MKVVNDHAFIVSEAASHGMQVCAHWANNSHNQSETRKKTFPLHTEAVRFIQLKLLSIQVFDLSLLRESDGFQEFEATALFENFGNAHNIVANDETDFVYVVGATQNYPGYTCSGNAFMFRTGHRKMFAKCAHVVLGLQGGRSTPAHLFCIKTLTNFRRVAGY